ncbi:helix-turn-helix domain-containing protein [bacterium]|nr:helix-turn-helix domain-containing protein [bacterium]
MTQQKDGHAAATPAKGKAPIGEQLRMAREQRGVSLSEASAQTKLKVPYLDALEQGRFDELPAPIYAKNFVRIYANYLGLDGAELARSFSTRVGPETNFPPHATPSSSYHVARLLNLGLRKAFILVIVIAAIVLIGIRITRSSGAPGELLDPSARTTTELLDAQQPVADLDEPLPPLE